jgi:hypothetical protein
MMDTAVGKYHIKDDNNNWIQLGCAMIGYPKGVQTPWILAPTNDYLQKYPSCTNLSFTDEQYKVANPLFWDASGLDLTGTNTEFAVYMTKTTTL